MMYTIQQKVPIYYAGTRGPVILCLHGAGHSAMSFACIAHFLKPTYQIISFDFRGHGHNKSPDEANMAQSTLINDTDEVMNFLMKKYSDFSFVILGHSMGGAIATKFVEKALLFPSCKYIENIKGVCFISTHCRRCGRRNSP